MSRIDCGNCLTILPTLPKQCVDFVLTDPPYLVNYKDRTGRSIANDKDDAWLKPAFAEIYRVMRSDSLCVSFYAWNRIGQFMNAWSDAGFCPVSHIVFTKNYASKTRFFEYRHEAAYVLAKGRPAVPDHPLPDVLPWKYSENKLHPTQKPVESIQEIIEALTKPGDIVMDPFAGSGTTCVAARHCGRRYFGIELDPAHHATATARLAALASKSAA